MLYYILYILLTLCTYAQADTWKAYSCAYQISEFDINNQVVTRTIGPAPLWTMFGTSSISPDGKKLFLKNKGGSDLCIMTLESTPEITQLFLPTIPLVRWTSPAISPDGKIAYVLGESTTELYICSVDLSTFSISPAHLVCAKNAPFDYFTSDKSSFALSPDGTRLYCYAIDSTLIHILNTADFSEIEQISVPQKRWRGLQIHPDGNTLFLLYMEESSPNNIFQICSIPVNGTSQTIDTIEDTYYWQDTFCVSPDGNKIYIPVFNSISHTGSVLQFDLSTKISQRFDSTNLLDETQFPNPGIAITPDGTKILTLYLASNKNHIQTLDLQTGTFSEVAVPTEFPNSPCILITPDQAPTADFLFSQSSDRTFFFDASNSFSPVGTVALYAWDFGDGTTVETTDPLIQHTYASAGNFEVSLTVTNSAGTSLKKAFTGQFVIRNGDPKAQTKKNITVPNPPIPPSKKPLKPKHFKGKVCKLHHGRHHKYYKLSAHWSKSKTPGVSSYYIYRNHTLWKIVPADQKRCFTALQYSHKVHKKYKISAVLPDGLASKKKKLHVESKIKPCSSSSSSC